MANHRLIFIFLDGLGLGTDSDFNPFFRRGKNGFLFELLHGIPGNQATVKTDMLFFTGIDAVCGVPGLPQSATGQTSLFTGVNAAGEIGFHCPAFPPPSLVAIIKKGNLLSKVLANGKKPVFANAYSPRYFEYVKEKKRRMSVTTHCVLASGIPFLMMEDLLAGKAVFWDMTRQGLARYDLKPPVPIVSAAEAGTHLAGISMNHDLVVFESFLPDLIGHSRDMDRALSFLVLFDEFLASVARCVNCDTSILVTSDHGNFEDLRTSQHTSNPAFFLVTGPATPFFHGIKAITEVTPRILEVIG